MSAPSILRRLNILGAIALLAHVSMSLLSWLQASTLWGGETAPRAQAFFKTLAASLPWVPFRTIIDDNTAAVLSHLVPLAIASAAAVAMLVLIERTRSAVDESWLRAVKRWAFLFAAVSLPAFPVFTQDFWLSAAWGRMIVDGVNPYHVDLMAAAAQGLPLDHFPMKMPYGPLWGIVSALVAAIAGGNAIVTGVLFKLVLAATWFAGLALVDRILQPAGAASRCTGLVMVGWLPAGVTQSLAEGHNDIAMIALLLLWWHLVRSGAGGGYRAPLALAASTLCKYVSAPLLVLDALLALLVARQPVPRYALRMLPALALMLLVVGAFFRSGAFFDGVRLISSWQFLNMRHAFTALGTVIPLPFELLTLPAQAAFALIAIHGVVRAVRHPSAETQTKALISVMAFMAFAASPHLWPWYLIWVLPPAAFLPGWWLSRFVTGMALTAPFVIAFWWVDALQDRKDFAALMMYGIATLWTIGSRWLQPGAVPAGRTNVGALALPASDRADD